MMISNRVSSARGITSLRGHQRINDVMLREKIFG